MDEPPLPKLAILGIILLIGMVVPSLVENATQRKLEANNTPLNSEFAVIQGNSVVGTRLPYFPDIQVLGIEVSKQLYDIIECESGFDPKVCNAEYGCSSGMGLCQIIPSTLRYCEEKLGRKLDPFNPEDNLTCGIWLYENEGTNHWLPSKHCWNK